MFLISLNSVFCEEVMYKFVIFIPRHYIRYFYHVVNGTHTHIKHAVLLIASLEKELESLNRPIVNKEIELVI